MDLRMTAIHEAGHVVCSHRLDMEFGPVTVVQDGGKLGAMAAPGLDHVYDPDHAQKQIYAGERQLELPTNDN